MTSEQVVRAFNQLYSEVYVDGMIVNSMIDAEHGQDLHKTLDILRTFAMKLNPRKCVFGVRLSKFLGFIVSSRGIKANPNKIKEVQRLTGCIAALGRFMSQSADKCQPFFRVLWRRTNFVWDQEVLKTYLAHLPK